ncbi:MAG: hypothetical protein KIS62_05580 [Ramlibacter sp.]|nr:hypothetical protein [Ramlibacter sp.]
MDFDSFIFPGKSVDQSGERSSLRGSVAYRPHHPDWPIENLRSVARFIANNPYVQDYFFSRPDVVVRRQLIGRCLAFIATIEGRAGGVTGGIA